VTLQPNVGVWVGRQPCPLVIEPLQTEVQIDGAAARRVRLDRLETETGIAPRAFFSAGLGCVPGTIEDVRLEHVAARIRPGARVTATLLRGGVWPGASREDLVFFDGRITQIQMALEPDGERLCFEAEDAAAELLRRRVGGQRLRTAGGSAELLGGLSLVFNPDGRPNASAEVYTPVHGEPYTIFEPVRSSEATAWTLGEAMAYVLAESGASDAINVPSPSEVRAALGSLVIRDVALEGRTLGEALGALLELAGARPMFVVEPGPAGVSRRLETLGPHSGPSGWLSHQRVGDRYDPSATHFAGLTVEMRFQTAPRRYVARGDRKGYESTFALVAGWDDALATYDPDDFSPSRNPNFSSVRDVFRKWVLNESGRYSASPYDRGPPPDLTGLFEGGPYVRGHRRLLPCLSRDALGRSRGVYPEMSLDGGSTWEQPAMAARVLTSECGLYFSDDPLPPRYIAAAMRGLVRVRVTASIESDSCLVAERVEQGAGGLPGRTRHIGAPAAYRYRRVATTSRFYGQGGADEVDDTARLQQLVDAAYEADRRSPSPARIDIPYLALGHRVGERILGVRGRRLDLARQCSGYLSAPIVRRVCHWFAPLPRTEIELE